MQVITKKEEWNKLLEEDFSQFNDVYFRYEYLELWAKHYGGIPEAIFWEDKNIKIFWTHLVRIMCSIDIERDFNTEFLDLTTPYGYGGPLIVSKTEDKEEIKKSFNRFLKEYGKRIAHKSELIRFHPVFKQWEYFQGATLFNLKHINDTVLIDLTPKLATIYKSVKKGHRYNINKSLERGTTVFSTIHPETIDIDNFISLYTKSMDRVVASKRYYFTTQFIMDHFKSLNALLVEAKVDDRVIGSSIFLLGDDIIHYHLSGSDYNYRNFYPSDLMLWVAIEFGKLNDFELMHLGGGVGKNDNLFKFKKGFSNTTLPFYIAKKEVRRETNYG